MPQGGTGWQDAAISARPHPDSPDCDAALMGQIADRVVTLSDLRSLANVLTMLVPRTQVA